MESGKRVPALIAIAVAAVAVAAAVGVYFLPPAVYGPSHYPTALPIPAGAVIHFWPLETNQEGTFVVPFDVPQPSGRFVGRWYADHGGALSICQTNSTCLILMPHTAYCRVPWNGSVEVTLQPGAYRLQVYGPRWDNITVQETIQVVPSGASTGTNGILVWSPCPVGVAP